MLTTIPPSRGAQGVNAIGHRFRCTGGTPDVCTAPSATLHRSRTSEPIVGGAPAGPRPAGAPQFERRRGSASVAGDGIPGDAVPRDRVPGNRIPRHAVPCDTAQADPVLECVRGHRYVVVERQPGERMANRGTPFKE